MGWGVGWVGMQSDDTVEAEDRKVFLSEAVDRDWGPKRAEKSYDSAGKAKFVLLRIRISMRVSSNSDRSAKKTMENTLCLGRTRNYAPDTVNRAALCRDYDVRFQLDDASCIVACLGHMTRQRSRYWYSGTLVLSI